MGLTIFRVAVPVEKAKEALGGEGKLPHWMVPDQDGKGCLTYFQSRDDSNRLIVTYPPSFPVDSLFFASANRRGTWRCGERIVAC